MTDLTDLTDLSDLLCSRWGLRPQTPSSPGSLALARSTQQVAAPT